MIMTEDKLLKAFVQFLQALSHPIQQSSQLFSGVILLDFLCSVENTSLKKEDIIRDDTIHGAGLSNLKLLSAEIQRYNQIQFKNENYKLQCSVNIIFLYRNEEQLVKLVKQCFIIAVKSPNNSYFIEKVLSLEESSQVLLANLIKQDGKFTPHANKQNPQIQKQEQISTSAQAHALDLIDKIYEIQQENERLQHQIKKLNTQNSIANENCIQLNSQIKVLKSHNQHLKKQLHETSQAMQRLGTLKLKSAQSQNRNQQCRKDLQILKVKYKEQMELARIQSQSSKRKFQTRISQLEEEVKFQRDSNIRLRQQMQYYQTQIEQMLLKFGQCQQQLSEANATISQYQKIAQQLRQSQATLKLQMNYKDLQIEQLKQIVHATNKVAEEFEDHKGEKKQLKSSKMLASQFSMNTCSSPNLRNSSMFKSQVDQIRGLKNQLRELEREKQKLKQAKQKIKELQYERNKLIKILKQYQVSRGEQNQIVTGCLYQLHLKLSNNKQIFSNSTLTDQFYN